MVEKILYVLLIFVWSIGRYVDIIPLGFTASSPLWTCLSFSFAHANVFHLLLNIYIIHSFYKPLRHFHPVFMALAMFYVPFLAAAISRVVMPFDTVTLGASGIAFMLVGMFTAEYTIKRRLYFYSSLCVAFAVQFVLADSINVYIHLFAFALGFIAAKCYCFFFHLLND